MSKSSGNAGYGLVMFLAGAAVGAGVALLYAPQEGEATRRTLGEKANALGEKAGAYRDKASEVTGNVAQAAKEKIGLVSDKASELMKRAQTFTEEAADSISEKAHAGADGRD